MGLVGASPSEWWLITPRGGSCEPPLAVYRVRPYFKETRSLVSIAVIEHIDIVVIRHKTYFCFDSEFKLIISALKSLVPTKIDPF